MDPYEWQQARRRPTGMFHFPVQGFGPDENFTLWVPSAEPISRFIFREGRPVRETADSVLDRPGIADLREQAIRSFVATDLPTRLSVGTVFLEYTAAVLNINYATPGQDRLSDEDLTFILDGQRWMKEMVHHLCGGERFLSTLEKYKPVVPSIRFAPIPSEPIQPPPSFWNRLVRRIRRR